MSLLFSTFKLGSQQLQNRLVMAPMTRNRAIGNVPNQLMVEYYRQRASAGLIITEGTSPSPNGLGYARIPGIFSEAQVAGWRPITASVHQGGAKFFMQLMHTGRIGHALNLPAGARVLGPSAVAAAGEMYTDTQGMQPQPVPEAMSDADIQTAIAEFAQAARNAMQAGFDGVELHAANGYLLEQFIRPTSNQRQDNYGGGIDNRARFVLEVADAVSAAIGKDKVGIRLSPYGVFNDMPLYDAMEADYIYLAQQLNARGLLYVHLVDHTAMGAPAVPASIKDAVRAHFRGALIHQHRDAQNTFDAVRAHFRGALILSGGYDAARAENDLAAGKADLIAVARPFLANPDLPVRWKTRAALNDPDFNTFYTPGEKGYIDYPALT